MLLCRVEHSAIDITTASRRSAGNLGFALAARLGMLVGVAAGIWMFQFKGFSMTAYFSILCSIFSILFALRVYVAFRAPIGVGHCNLASRPQFGTDCFYSRHCIIVNQTRGLCCTVFSRCSGSAYDTFYEDIC